MRVLVELWLHSKASLNVSDLEPCLGVNRATIERAVDGFSRRASWSTTGTATGGCSRGGGATSMREVERGREVLERPRRQRCCLRPPAVAKA